MYKKITIGVYLIVTASMFLLFTNSCTKKTDEPLKNDPIITWANPEDIIYGTVLSDKQLNATTDIPGSFVYTPAIGTKLNAGVNQELKVDFTPTDGTLYNSGSTTVKIYVVPTSGTVTDIEGNVYHTITIGTQTWMIENLMTTKLNDNTAIANLTEEYRWDNLNVAIPAYCWYNNDAATYKAKYGALYNWYTVKTGKLAPVGWHVPTNAEWSILENYLISNGYNYDGTTSENKIAMALASSLGWRLSDGKGAVGYPYYPDKRNASGFTALPGGSRYGGEFGSIGYASYWWSSSQYDNSDAIERSIHSDRDYVTNYHYGLRDGLSVRCVRD